MSEVERLKADHELLKTQKEALACENEQLKCNLMKSHTDWQNLHAQLEAYKGELTDARTISLQLRLNMGMALKTNQALELQVKDLASQLKELKDKQAEPAKQNKD